MKAEAEGTVIAANGDRKLTFSPSAEGDAWAVCRGGKRRAFASVVEAVRALMEIEPEERGRHGKPKR